MRIVPSAIGRGSSSRVVTALTSTIGSGIGRSYEMVRAMRITELASALAWPEGPTVLPDGRVVFVETYRSRISAWSPGREVEQFAFTGGGPNATALGSDGHLYL